jgi:hypothetical protein
VFVVLAAVLVLLGLLLFMLVVLQPAFQSTLWQKQ